MGTVVKTSRSGGGGDYTTILAFLAAVPANLVTDGNSYVGNCYNDAVFDDGQISFSGHTTDSTHTITVQAAPGQSFRDNVSAQTNALRWNQSNGVALQRTVAASTTITTGDDYVFLSGLQIKSTDTGSSVIKSG